jgi:ribonuclease BN (tRNA processing enzyme)
VSAPARPRLRFVGSGDAFGNGGRFQTCFHLTGASDTVLIDCGASSLTALKASRIEPNEIDTVLLSHLHGDHFGGIPFLILDGQFRRRERPLTIAGPRGTRARTEALMDLVFPGSTRARRRFAIEFIELEPATPTSIGAVSVDTAAVEQPGTPACALRIGYEHKTVVYTGDMAWTDELVKLSAGADLLIAEAYFFDRDVPYHLSHNTLVRHHARLTASRIIVTHMSPDMLARADEAEFELAYDGMLIEL